MRVDQPDARGKASGLDLLSPASPGTEPACAGAFGNALRAFVSQSHHGDFTGRHGRLETTRPDYPLQYFGVVKPDFPMRPTRRRNSVAPTVAASSREETPRRFNNFATWNFTVFGEI